ncbi:MAG: CTB family bacteriocin [Gloeotrichia echinulata IR180]|jgi:hypothetical protein|nr:CTB family bacteriocin [Gloeotrichia echinulata DEX184]
MSKQLFVEVAVEQQEIVAGGTIFSSSSEAEFFEAIYASPTAKTPNTFASVPLKLITKEESEVNVFVWY